MPARSAGVSGWTSCTQAPLSTGRSKRSTSCGNSGTEETPRNAYWALPVSRSAPSERLTTSTGTANPTPSPPPELVLICWLMPITLPSAATSGPPELPGLIAASVWIAPGMAKEPLSDWMSRSIAETTPTDSDWRSPNGEPIAATGSPTCTSALEPSGSGRSVRPFGSILSSATSALGSWPLISASTRLPSANST
jgi:hypothetical protein